MDFNSIDWNALWLAESASSVWNKTSQKELWNKRADSFSRRINRVTSGQDKLDKDDYIYKMLERVEVKPGWSLLDIGCGPGTICLPLASKAGSVTALDISSEMLKNLRATAQANNLNNIRYINSSWQEAGEDNLVEEHDVVVASRSMMQGDMRQAMSLIIKCARRQPI
jgi:2-polyprenyl-3-methyl-5-hydroxy-6-metoxy-1,4-benzoquinol methylase